MGGLRDMDLQCSARHCCHQAPLISPPEIYRKLYQHTEGLPSGSDLHVAAFSEGIQNILTRVFEYPFPSA